MSAADNNATTEYSVFTDIDWGDDQVREDFAGLLLGEEQLELTQTVPH